MRPSELSEPLYEGEVNKGGTASMPRPLMGEAFVFNRGGVRNECARGA